jgi:hypothetical protein
MILEDSDIEAWIINTDIDKAAKLLCDAMPMWVSVESLLTSLFRLLPEDRRGALLAALKEETK